MKKNWRLRLGFALGAIATLLGELLRIEAERLAWPAGYSYMGPRENTSWAHVEAIYRDIGTALLGFGLAVIAVCVHRWLWYANPGNKES